jgi:hypothetical protein
MSFSSLRMRLTQSTTCGAPAAGLTAKAWQYLLL